MGLHVGLEKVMVMKKVDCEECNGTGKVVQYQCMDCCFYHDGCCDAHEYNVEPGEGRCSDEFVKHGECESCSASFQGWCNREPMRVKKEIEKRKKEKEDEEIMEKQRRPW